MSKHLSLINKGGDISTLRTLIYCRESRDDNQEFYERIETQRDYLLDWCKERGLTNFVCPPIMDDNKSGVYFDRLDSIKEMISRKELDVLVIKDSSRLGRNATLGMLFKEEAEAQNVTVLFTDEDNSEPLFYQMRSIFNEQRAREDSKKVIGVLRFKMSMGELVIHAPYGYIKVDKGLIVDEEAARVIRRIYAYALEGYGARAIASILNLEVIATPSQHTFQETNRPIAPAWTQQQVRRILNNEVYTGKILSHQTVKPSFKRRRRVRVPREEWIVVADHHEPIVREEDFRLVNEIRTGRTKKTTKKQTAFSGMVKCGRCGRNLAYINTPKRPHTYICGKYHEEGKIKNDIRPDYGCHHHSITLKHLTDRVKEYCRQAISTSDFEVELKERMIKSKETDSEQRAGEIRREIKRFEQIIETNYGNWLEGIISKDMYLNKNKEYQEKKRALEHVLEGLSAGKPRRKTLNYPLMLKLLESHELDNFTIRSCFDKIVYFMPNEITEYQRLEYGFDMEQYEDVFENGGLVFFLREGQ